VKDSAGVVGTVHQEYSRQMDLKEMVAQEKSTTAADQLTMFGRAAKVLLFFIILFVRILVRLFVLDVFRQQNHR